MSLILDHIDGDNKNDELSNLRWVCPNCNMQLPTTNRRKSVFDESRIRRCVDCGIKINYKSTIRCSNCEKKRRLENTSHIPLTRDDLKKYIRTTPFIQIGKIFNVSDNAVRKWCKKRNFRIILRKSARFVSRETIIFCHRAGQRGSVNRRCR